MLQFNFVFKPFDQTVFYQGYQDQYNKGWITKEALHDLVVRGFLTAEWYKKITGDDYVAQANSPVQN